MTQGWNWRLLHWRADSLPAEPSGEPWVEEGAARRCSGSEKPRRPGVPPGELAVVWWLSPGRRMLLSARWAFAGRPFPPWCLTEVWQEPVGIKWKARKVRGGSSCQITRLAGPGAHCSRPASPPARLLQKDAPGSVWTSATSKPSVTLSHLVPTSLFCEVSITERPRRQKRKRQGPKELGVRLRW